jgi:hypothetical protein
MSALTAGNWIAYQNPSQVQYGHWSVGIENQYGIHGVGSGELRDVTMDVGGICTEADAKAMAASKELLELAYQYQSDLRHPPTADSVTRRLERIAAVLAKVGA